VNRVGAKREVQTINWVIFTLFSLAALVSAGSTFSSLRSLTHEQEREGQSSLSIHWEQGDTIFACMLGVLITLMIMRWKWLFPHNVPLTVIMGGICYAFLFQVTTAGWVGLMGFIGFLIAAVAGIIMMLIYALGEKHWRLREHK
jgi:hypothetical protein